MKKLKKQIRIVVDQYKKARIKLQRNEAKFIFNDLKELQNTMFIAQNKISTMISYLLMEDIIKFLDKCEVISTAKLQRKFRIGYASARLCLEKLEGLHYIKKSAKALTQYIVIKK